MVSTILEPFIEGPLSDRRGGSLHARAATERLLSENEDLGDELSSDARARQRRLVIRGPEPLFDYQDEVVSALLARRNECCNPRSLVSLPTGAGKTRTAIWLDGLGCSIDRISRASCRLHL
jgi:type I site-specific restriction endonuclease